MRLGLYGGTFDPVHYGHLLLAESCREQFKLDEIWFIPAGDPPHKSGRQISPGKARADMLEFALAGFPEFTVNRMELERAGKSYTVDTLQELKTAEPDRELFFLIGGDSLHDLPDWREPARICELATVVAVNRGDVPLPERVVLDTKLGSETAARIRYAQMPGVDFSSTRIRECARNGDSIRFRLPRAVECYIREQDLYSSTATT